MLTVFGNVAQTAKVPITSYEKEPVIAASNEHPDFGEDEKKWRLLKATLLRNVAGFIKNSGLAVELPGDEEEAMGSISYLTHSWQHLKPGTPVVTVKDTSDHTLYIVLRSFVVDQSGETPELVPHQQNLNGAGRPHTMFIAGLEIGELFVELVKGIVASVATRVGSALYDRVVKRIDQYSPMAGPPTLREVSPGQLD